MNCAGQACAPGEICCFHNQDASQDHCGAEGSCGPPEYLAITCNGPDDCPGEICCGTFNGQDYTEVSCRPTCQNQGNIILCDGDPNVCPPNDDCLPSQVLGGYLVCR
ncbi:MAG: hypothetical protein IPM54_24815 [Polyangiaceae bacterium]|nr:hypothetical protein [Polyangiaceae bacterium]